MKSRVRRQPCLSSARFLVRRRPAPTHHVEGATGSATRNRVLSTTIAGTKRLATRGQHRRGCDAVQTNHSLSRHDDQIKKALALARRPRHKHPTEVHSLSTDHLGRQPQPGARPRRVTA
jgi:hypothetical protein